MMLPQDAIAEVARAMRVSTGEIYGRKRHLRIATARHIAMYLIRENTKLSYPEIGRMLGRHHSSAIHAHQLIKRRIAESTAFKLTVDNIANGIHAEHLIGCQA